MGNTLLFSYFPFVWFYVLHHSNNLDFISAHIFNLHAEDLGPPYWITMGADAIAVLAGSVLIINAEKWQILIELLPFLKGFTLLFWAIGTW